LRRTTTTSTSAATSTTPHRRPQDVRAHLHGGVPKAEVAAKTAQFAAYGIDAGELFAERDADYYDFPPEGHEAIAARIAESAAARERELVDAYDTW
jgi:type I restriction enzyme M protein